MPRRPPSPVRLRCKRPWADYGDDMLVCRWTCPRGGEPVQFRAKWREDMFAILHRSTKERGRWQLTTFDKDGPIGDVIRSTCEEALYDGGVDRSWKLEKMPRKR